MRSAIAIPLLLFFSSFSSAEESSVTTPTRMTCRSLYQACLDARDPARLSLRGDAFERGRARAEQRRVRARVLGALLEVELPAVGFAFEEYDYDGELLAVGTRRNLRLWGGRMALYPTGGDEISFPAAPDRAREIVERHRRRDVRLRIGFVLGRDDPHRDPCLLRPGVPPIVKADVAYFELVDGEGRILAREDTARLADAHTLEEDPERGAGTVHVTVAPPAVTGNRAYRAVLEAHFREDGAARLAESIRSCVRAEGPAGTLVVVFNLDGTGRTSDVGIEVDSLHEPAMSACVRDEIVGGAYPRGSRRARVRISVPVMITRN